MLIEMPNLDILRSRISFFLLTLTVTRDVYVTCISYVFREDGIRANSNVRLRFC